VEQHQDARLDKIELWISGGVGADGKPIPGLLRAVEALALQAAELKTWIIRLGAAVVAGVFANAAITLMHYAGMFPATAAAKP